MGVKPVDYRNTRHHIGLLYFETQCPNANFSQEVSGFQLGGVIFTRLPITNWTHATTFILVISFKCNAARLSIFDASETRFKFYILKFMVGHKMNLRLHKMIVERTNIVFLTTQIVFFFFPHLIVNICTS